jgi:hypothetical protein
VHSALVRADKGIANDLRRAVVEPDVVERKLQRLAGAFYERRDLPSDVQRRLAAVGEGLNLEQAPKDTRARRSCYEPPAGKWAAMLSARGEPRPEARSYPASALQQGTW